MSLPQHNPIDFGWFNKGVALDHTSTIPFFCECCGKETPQEQFKLVVGQILGFGTPFFVQPFMKRQSTKGRLAALAVSSHSAPFAIVYGRLTILVEKYWPQLESLQMD